jgi:hypothetical protein
VIAAKQRFIEVVVTAVPALYAVISIHGDLVLFPALPQPICK